MRHAYCGDELTSKYMICGYNLVPVLTLGFGAENPDAEEGCNGPGLLLARA